MDYRGLFVGLTTIDIQYFVDSFPGSNQKVKTNPPKILVGGPATNAAVAFAYLNNGTFLATASGINSFSQFIKNDFKTTNIEHFDLVGSQKTNPVIASVITSNNNGDRNIVTHNPIEIQPNISPSELFQTVNPQILLLDGFYPEFSLSCAKLAKNNGIPVVLDCGSWKPQYSVLLNYTDVAICSSDFYPQHCSTSDEVLSYLETLKIKNIAISHGNKSIKYSENRNRGAIKIIKAQVTDTLGAGDFLHGAFCYFYLKSENFAEALEQASKLASFSCNFEGTRDWLKFME